VTLFYVKQEMTQAYRGTQAIVTGSDGGNDWSSIHTGPLVFESWVSNSRSACGPPACIMRPVSVYYAARQRALCGRPACIMRPASVYYAARQRVLCVPPACIMRPVSVYYAAGQRVLCGPRPHL
jgi:hypothetical protein